MIVGSANDIVRGGTGLDKGQGLIVGDSNLLSSNVAYGAIIGRSNDAKLDNSLVVGVGNDVTSNATTWQETAGLCAVFGAYNTVAKDTDATLVSGKLNAVRG